MEDAGKGLLGEEIEYYNRHRDVFSNRYTNRHLLIKGSKLVGSFPTADQAVAAGVRRFGIEPFLVRLSGADTPKAQMPKLMLGIPWRSSCSAIQ